MSDTLSDRRTGSDGFWSTISEGVADALASGVRGVGEGVESAGRSIAPVWFASLMGLQSQDQLADPTRGRDPASGSQTRVATTADSGVRFVPSGIDATTWALLGAVVLLGTVLLVRRS